MNADVVTAQTSASNPRDHSVSELIAAVVVTYNRKALLCECLDALLKQTRPLDAIYVIDNASTDGTRDLLDERGYLRENKIRYFLLPENTGGAGGFAEGLKLAFEAGFEWFWLMDDDVEPYPDGLEQLYQFSSESHCIHGRKTAPDGSPVPWGEWFDPRAVTTRPIKDQNFTQHQRLQEVGIGCFEGMLIARDVVTKIGYPCRDLFIMLDDTFYGFLASQVTKVVYVNVFSLKRKRHFDSVTVFGLGKRVVLSPRSAYYYQRNRFLIARQLNTVGLTFFCTTVYRLSRNLSRDLITRDFTRMFATARGLFDGMRGVQGRKS
jgi:rhamnopyranosyl-N-acetylglucosaminyl-diphospho-decaprenol beta-1,3/1,4-galactofuranosyltransferase